MPVEERTQIALLLLGVPKVTLIAGSLVIALGYAASTVLMGLPTGWYAVD